MNILVVGNGGREHAIAWKVAQNEEVSKVYCAPGNGGTAIEKKCENINISKIEEMVSFAKENKIDLTIVGPEVYLCDGIVDEFKKNGLKIFGPSKYAANLEGSKSFAKEFMKKYGVRTASYEVFTKTKNAIEYLKTLKEYPVVIKADGLAAGKGVVIAETFEEAEKTVNEFISNDIFEGSGKTIVIEEFLEGVEASILSITDGKTIIPFISAKDHKKIFEGEKGPNTGGMGAISPNPYCTDEVMDEFKKNILEPTIKGIKAENMDYVGIIFFGLMITKKGVYALEYNVRMGDPETQAVLPLMDSDLVYIIDKALEKKLSDVEIKWKNAHSTCVATVSEGYPAKYEKGFKITGIGSTNGKVFVAGGIVKNGELVTNGGRVLNIVNLGNTLEESRSKTYEDVTKVNFKGMYYRKDIGMIK